MLWLATPSWELEWQGDRWGVRMCGGWHRSAYTLYGLLDNGLRLWKELDHQPSTS